MMNLTQPPPTFLLNVIKYPVFLNWSRPLVKHNRAKYTPTAILYIPQHLIQLTNEALH